jgi:HlyD family secretion protein
MATAQKKEAVQRQQTETELAEQRLEAAQLAVRQAEESREVELAAQQKQLEVANLKVAQAEADLKQLTALSGGDDPIVSKQKVRQQNLLRELSLAERDAAEVARKRLEQSLRFQGQQAAAEERAATRALKLAQLGTPLELLDARIALAELKIRQTKIHSPLAGTVLNVWAHSGELVTPQPLLEIADLQDLICVVEVDIADVPLLSVGQAAVITSPAFHGDKVSGVIEQIGVGASPPSLRQLDPRQSLDRTVTKVRLKIDARDAVAALGGAESSAVVLVGLRVDVEFALPAAAE